MGPGGTASPGQYSAVAVGLVLLSCFGLFFGETASLVFVFTMPVAALVLLMGLCGCGYQKQATAYQGSTCPQCGHKNWIWPWNF